VTGPDVGSRKVLVSAVCCDRRTTDLKFGPRARNKISFH
jgi:hypothetical protein